jgi:signal peptidase I
MDKIDIRESVMSNKPRRPLIAALLSLLSTGLGHFYSGNPKRGLFFFGIGAFLVLVFAASFALIDPNVFFILFAVAIGIAFIVFYISDAILIAKRNKEYYEPAKYNRWYVYIGYIVMATIFNCVYAYAIIVPFFVQAYKLPTGSMEPTLLVGDHLLVNKLIYKTALPKQGDIIVFKYPRNLESAHIKRLIGEPGDTVEMTGRLVLLNGKPLKENYVKHINPESVYDHFGPYRIPPDNYFVLGDNRDNSMDSRYFGYVPRENLIGKPLFIYWANPPILTNDLDGETSKTRWSRIFQIIK